MKECEDIAATHVFVMIIHENKVISNWKPNELRSSLYVNQLSHNNSYYISGISNFMRHCVELTNGPIFSSQVCI